MDNRSPLVFVALLVGGLLLAGAGGFVVARQFTAPPAAPVIAEAQTPELAVAERLEGTEALIEPLVVEDTEPNTVRRAEPAAPLARPEPASTPRATPRPAAARDTSARATPPPVTRPAPPATPNRAPGSATASSSPATDAAPAARSGVYSRPFPSPEAMSSLPNRVPPRIDAPPPPPKMRTVTLPADSVVGLQVEQTVSSESAKVEDTVRARVTRDVLADGVVMIPAGSRVEGSVTLVEQGGKVRDRARLGVRFHTLVLADGTQVRLNSETIYRDGEAVGGRSTARIGGGAAAGAVIGAILGGGKGAAVGAAVGAGTGTASTMAGGRSPATLPQGQTVTVRISSPMSVDVEEP